jgi:hypothetical protein
LRRRTQVRLQDRLRGSAGGAVRDHPVHSKHPGTADASGFTPRDAAELPTDDPPAVNDNSDDDADDAINDADNDADGRMPSGVRLQGPGATNTGHLRAVG